MPRKIPGIRSLNFDDENRSLLVQQSTAPVKKKKKRGRVIDGGTAEFKMSSTVGVKP